MKDDKKNLKDISHQANHTDKKISEIEKSQVHIIVEIIEYVPNAVVSKTIIKKSTGNITVSSSIRAKNWLKRFLPSIPTYR